MITVSNIGAKERLSLREEGIDPSRAMVISTKVRNIKQHLVATFMSIIADC